MSKRDINQLINRIDRHGGYTRRVDGQGHWVIESEDTGASVRLPRTPSDYRGYQNSLRDLRRIGYHDRHRKPRRKKKRPHEMPNLSELAQVTTVGGKSVREPPDVITDVRGSGRFLWGVIRDLAKHNNETTITHKGATGYKWTGRLSDLMMSLWPDDLRPLGSKARTYRVSRVRDPLTAAGNLVVLHPGNPSTPTTFWVRAEWNDGSRPQPEATPTPDGAPPVRVSAPPAVVVSERSSEPARHPPVPAVGGSAPAAQDADASTPTPARVDIEQMIAFLAEHDTMLKEREQLAGLFDDLSRAFTGMQDAVKGIREILRGRDS